MEKDEQAVAFATNEVHAILGAKLPSHDGFDEFFGVFVDGQVLKI